MQHLKDEIRRLTREFEDCQNEVENLQFYLRESQEEASRYRWAAKGGIEWLKFMDTPLFDELSNEQRREVHWVFQRIGEPLAAWQIRELANFLPVHRKQWDDLRARIHETEERLGLHNGDEGYWNAPELVALAAEKRAHSRAEDEKLQEVLGQELASRYFGQE